MTDIICSISCGQDHLYFKSRIFKAERYSITMDCQMNFRMFPFDHQLCPLTLESYSYSNDQVFFEWDENYSTPIEYSDDIEVNDLEQGPKFVRPTCTKEYSTGNFSCLRPGSKCLILASVLEIHTKKQAKLKWIFCIGTPNRILFDLGIFPIGNVCFDFHGWILDQIDCISRQEPIFQVVDHKFWSTVGPNSLNESA